MTTADRKLVLVVDADPGFVERARALMERHRTLTARDLSEAHEIVLGGRVDVVILGPTFASDQFIAEAAVLSRADATARIVLVADIVTNRLLKAALRAGFADVVDAPLTAAALDDVFPIEASLPIEVDLVVEDSDGSEVPIEATIPVPHHPSQYEPEAAETIGSGNGWNPPIVDEPADMPYPESGVPETVVPPIGGDPAPAVPETHPTPPPALAGDEPIARATPHSNVVEPMPVPLPDSPVWPDEPMVASPPDPEPFVPSAPEPETVLAPPEMPPPVVVVPAEPQSNESPVGEGSEPPAAVVGPGRVIAVMAGKGGSGKSVVATNLAVAFGMRHDPERIAIVDADLQFGDVALMLQVDPVRTIDDVAGQLDSLTDARLAGALLQHESGMRVLPAPLTPVQHDEITAKSVVEIVDRLRGFFDTIVVDTGPVFGDGLVTILEHADAVVAVVDMDLPSVKNAKVALDTLRGAGFPMERITLVVNRVNSKARLDLGELERSLGLRVGGSVPSDRLVPQSVNEGIPLLTLSPRSKVARSFIALAESLDPSADRARLGGGGR